MAAGGILLGMAGPYGPPLLLAAVNLAVCVRFGVTLRPGSVPLITRYARFDEAGLPSACEGYTRALTAVWTAALALFALTHAAVVLDVWTARNVSAVESAALLALFLGEHPLRNRLFPQIGPATPLRTLRAMRMSFGASHAG